MHPPIQYPPPPTLLSRHAPSREHCNTFAQPLPPRRCPTFQAQAGHVFEIVGRDTGGVAGVAHTPGSVHFRKATGESDSRHTIAIARPSALQCIQVGDAFFPTQPSPENAVHDIYIRATSARHKNPPLKYYAKVVGKFKVHRDRLDEIGDKIGRTRKDAEELRQQRKIQMIDGPPADVLNAGKRKDAKPKKSAPTPTSKRPTPAPSSNTPSSGFSTPSLGNDFRSRLIQCLSASPRTTEECIKLLLGRNSNPDTRKEFLRMLAEVCDGIYPPLPFLTGMLHRSRICLHLRRMQTPRHLKCGP